MAKSTSKSLDLLRRLGLSQGSVDVSGLSSDQREAFEERATIMEFDGGLPRADAERAALVNVLRQMTARTGN
jgi:hypothetical protein